MSSPSESNKRKQGPLDSVAEQKTGEPPAKARRKTQKTLGPPGLRTNSPDPLYDTTDDYLMKLNNELNIGVALVKQMKEQNEDEQLMLNDGIGNNGLQPLNPAINLKSYDGVDPKFTRNH